MAKILCNEDGISQGERWFLIYKYLLQYTCKGHEASIRDTFEVFSLPSLWQRRTSQRRRMPAPT